MLSGACAWTSQGECPAQTLQTAHRPRRSSPAHSRMSHPGAQPIFVGSGGLIHRIFKPSTPGLNQAVKKLSFQLGPANKLNWPSFILKQPSIRRVPSPTRCACSGNHPQKCPCYRVLPEKNDAVKLWQRIWFQVQGSAVERNWTCRNQPLEPVLILVSLSWHTSNTRSHKGLKAKI